MKMASFKRFGYFSGKRLLLNSFTRPICVATPSNCPKKFILLITSEKWRKMCDFQIHVTKAWKKTQKILVWFPNLFHQYIERGPMSHVMNVRRKIVKMPVLHTHVTLAWKWSEKYLFPSPSHNYIETGGILRVSKSISPVLETGRKNACFVFVPQQWPKISMLSISMSPMYGKTSENVFFFQICFTIALKKVGELGRVF